MNQDPEILTPLEIAEIIMGGSAEIGELPAPRPLSTRAKIKKADGSAYLKNAAGIGRFFLQSADERLLELQWTSDKKSAGLWKISDAELMVAVINEQLWISCVMEVCHE